MKNNYDHIVKIMLVGDSGVGKTAIMNRYCEDIYSDRTTTTIGLDYKDKVSKINGKKCLIQLWDTAGQQRFKTITPNFYRSAMAILLVYSVEDRETFSSIGAWLKQIKKYAPDNLPIILLANKCDLIRRQILQKQGKTVAEQYEIEFMECSAKQDMNITQAIQKLAKNVNTKIQKQQKVLGLESKQAKSKYCSC